MLSLAFDVILADASWFFPAMLLVIGGRDLVFATPYGRRLHWYAGLGLTCSRSRARCCACRRNSPPLLAR